MDVKRIEDKWVYSTKYSMGTSVTHGVDEEYIQQKKPLSERRLRPRSSAGDAAGGAAAADGAADDGGAADTAAASADDDGGAGCVLKVGDTTFRPGMLVSVSGYAHTIVSISSSSEYIVVQNDAGEAKKVKARAVHQVGVAE